MKKTVALLTVALLAVAQMHAGDIYSIITNFVTRTVYCEAAADSFVSVTFGREDETEGEIEATTNHIKSAATMYVRLSKEYTEDIWVDIGPQVVGNVGFDVFEEKVIGVTSPLDLSYNATFTNRIVKIPAGQTQVPFFVFALGATAETAAYDGGITFTPTLADASFPDAAAAAAAHTFFNGEFVSSRLRVTDQAPLILSPEDGRSYSGWVAQSDQPVSIKINDNYRDLLPSSTCTVTWSYGNGMVDTFTLAPTNKLLNVTVKYPTKGDFSSTVTVTDQNGNVSAGINLNVTVLAPKTVSANLYDTAGQSVRNERITYAEGETPRLKFELSKPHSMNLYAYLVPLNEASSNMVASAAFESGAVIPANTTLSTPSYFSLNFLDGCDDSTDLKFGVMLRDNPHYNQGWEISGVYLPEMLCLSVTNTAPAISGVDVNGISVDNGGVSSSMVFCAVPTQFDAALVDPAVNDITNGLITCWKIRDGLEGHYIYKNIYVTNDTVNTSCTYTFAIGGQKQLVTVKAQDKDMVATGEWGPEYSFYVNIDEPPYVSVITSNADRHYAEDSKNGYIMASLSTPASEDLVIELTTARQGMEEREPIFDIQDGILVGVDLNGCTSVTIPSSVTSIGGGAFADCSGLTSVTIPDSVASIGDGAFLNCNGLTSVTIPNSVTSIEYGAFAGCSGLTSVMIPNSVTSIGDYAFRGCSSLTSVTIPDSVTSIGCGAFSDCEGLADSSGFVIVRDALYGYFGDELDVVIPNHVTSIGDFAFASWSDLTSVTIPDSVTSIGIDAFYGCSGLTDVAIPNSVTSIGYRAFYNCSGLTNIMFEGNAPTVGEDAFLDVNNECVVYVRRGSTGWGVDIPGMWQGMRIEYLDEGLQPIFTIENGVLTGVELNGNTSVEVPAGVFSIGERAFEECSGLSRVVIPEGVTNIGDYAFMMCSELINVTFPDTLTDIGDAAFLGCTSLDGIVVPGSVRRIGVAAFQACTVLSALTIEHGVCVIDSYAFRNCIGLTSVVIPDSVVEVGSGAFTGCTSLRSVTMPRTAYLPHDDAFYGCNDSLVIIYTGAVPPAIENDDIAEAVLLAGVSGETTGTNVGATLDNGEHSYAYGDDEIVGEVWWKWTAPASGSVAFGTHGSNYDTSIAVYTGDVLKNLELVASDDDYYDDYTSRVEFNAVASTTYYIAVGGYGTGNIRLSWSMPIFDIQDGILVGVDLNGCTSVTIPSSVTSIGDYAFWGCSSLTSVTIPDSVTSIGDYAFWGCSSLTSVTIPDSVTSIGFGAFRDCEGLADSSGFVIVRDALYGYFGDESDVVIPNHVTSIGRYAFAWCSALTSVTIPDSVTSIGDFAFRGCSSLTSVTIPDSVTSIGFGAFRDCEGLAGSSGFVIVRDALYGYFGDESDVVIPNHVTSIVPFAFEGCSGLTSVTIPNSVTSIGDEAFGGCSGLTSVTIPDSVTNIGDGAFIGCSGLTSVTIPDSVTSIGDWAFEDCSGLTSVTIPDSVTSIGESAFRGCSSLTSVTIPDSVTSIGFGAFRDCEGLADSSGFVIVRDALYGYFGDGSDVVIPNHVTSIVPFAFEGCSGLTSVTIPNSVMSIGDEAFGGCSGLTSVTIPDSVTNIGDGAFIGCSGLTSVTIPGSVTSIGDWAFEDCSGLTSILVDPCNTTYKSVNRLLLSKDGKMLLEGVNGDVVVPDGVTSIRDGAFEGRSNLTSVTISASVTNIAYTAFGGCGGLASVTFLGNAPDIDGYAFDDMDPNCTVYVRRGTTGWGVDIPGTWQGMRIEYLEEGPQPIFTIENGVLTAVELNGATNVVIPSSVTRIGGWAFDGCIGLTSVTIPDSVESIYGSAFYGCSSLVDLAIGNGVTSIGGWAFSFCSNLTHIAIPPSVASIGFGAFDYCSGLKSFSVSGDNPNFKSSSGLLLSKDGNTLVSVPAGLDAVEIPAGVTNIGGYAFAGCDKLMDIVIPDGVVVIGRGAFEACTGLLRVSVPHGVMTIPGYAFNGCSGITNLTISASVASIEECAFQDCSSLASVVIPGSVASVGYDAFYGCSGLTNVTFNGNAPTVGGYAFSGVDSGCTVYVRKDSTGWGVSIPGTWQGLKIEYLKDATELMIVESDTSVSAINAQGSVNDRLYDVVVSDGATITVDAAFSSRIMSVSSTGSITLSAASQPNPDWFANVDFSGVQGALLRSWLAPGVVGFNFCNQRGADTSCALAEGTWHSDALSANGTSTVLFADGLSSLTWASAGAWSCSGNTIISGYLDDGAKNGYGAEVHLNAVPYETYDVIVYCSTDTSGQFLAKTVNGTTYTWDSSAGTAVEGDAAWGKTPFITPVYGVNALRIKNLSGPLTIYGGAREGYYSNIRGGIAAFQIMPSDTPDEEPHVYTYNNITYAYNVIDNGNAVQITAVLPDATGTLTIPDTVVGRPVTSIGERAFYNCSGLTSVTIGNSVTNIGSYAFYYCSGLTNVTFNGNAPIVGRYAFLNVDTGCTACVRKDSTGWGVDIPGTWQGMRIEYLEPDGPDLIIDGVVAEPTSFQPGDTVTVQYVADNYGVAEADGNWYDRIALEDAQGRRVVLATVAEIGPLPYSPLDLETGWGPVGGGFYSTATCAIPDLVPLAGEVRFVVVADVNNDVEEMDESNNESVSDWLILGKRLYLTASSDSVKENVSGGVRFTLRRSGPVDESLAVSVGNTGAAGASVPATVTIPAGSVSTIFTVAPIDNAIVDGTRVVNVSVAADGFEGAFVPLMLLDDEVPKLTVTLDKTSIREGDGVITATVTREGATDEPLTVYISGTSGSRASYPSSVVIPAGATSVTFDISVPNNDTAQVASDLTLRASSSGYQSSAVTYTVEDDDVPGVVLTIAPEVVQEGAGVSAAVMTLARVNTEDMSKAITVRLTASVANVLIMPKEVVIPANNPYVRQEIGVVDNSNVEADKEITITGAIVIPSCNCSAQPSSGGEIQAMLRIIDDDDLALKLRVEPLMMKEGQEIAGYIMVGQNTVLSENLAVSLYSDNDAEIELPPTVVIPAGETSARVPVKTLNDGVEDGTVQVNIYAEADGCAPDSKWVFVTDQNLPDLMPIGIEPQYATATAGESVSVSFVVTNIGYLTSKRSVPFSIYCVKGKSAIIEDAGILVSSGMTDGAVDIGASAEVSAIVTVPDITGDCRFAVVVDPDRLITELNDANNTAYSSVVSVSPSYIAEAQVEGERFLQGSTIEINGVAVKADGTTPAANVDVEIYVIKNEFRRQLKATTDAQGRFAATFKPTTSEAGHYVVGASFPGMNATAEQDAFDILGMKRTSDAYLEYNNIQLGDEMSKTVYIRNMSPIALTGISAQGVGVLSGCEIETSFADVLSGDATIPLTLTLRGTDLTSGRDYKEFTLRLTSAEGATLDIPVLYFVQYQQAHIKASPASINTTMTVGQTRYVDFTIYNDGRGDSGKVTILTSSFPWLSIEGGNEIANLASNESAIVTLKLTPGDDVELNNRYTGEIAVNCESGHGKGCVVPFAFKAVSEHTGTLKVDLVDGYTYYLDSAPHVSNATVRISNKYTGEIVASGTTGMDGTWTSGEIGEGEWQLAVSANGHKSYYDEVTVSPGTETVLPPIYLEAQTVTMSYGVTPTNIVDTYVVTLVTEYETSVPEPVLVTTFDGRIPNLQEGDAPFAFNAIVVNKGLVAVHGVYLEMPTIDGWEFTVGDSGFSLAPEESAVVPIIVRRPRKRAALMATAGAVTVTKVDCVDVVRTRGYWYCGGDRRWHTYTVQLPTERVCTTTTYTIVPTEEEPRPPSKPGRTGGGGGYVPGGGGGGTSRITISKTDCEPCVNSVREALLNCDISEDVAQRYQDLYDLLKDHYVMPEHVSKVPWFSDNQSFFGLSGDSRDIIYDMGLLANECYYDGTNNGFMRENFPYQVVGGDADGKPLSELISWPFYISDNKVVRSEWSDGFAASIYRSANGNYVLAFRGTEKDLNDISNDRRNAFLCEQTDQYRSAGLLLGQLLITTGDSHIDVTGHSLGGGLAQYAMAVNGYYADRFNGYTFNSAGQCSKLGLGFSMAASGIKTALKGKYNYYEIFKLGEEYGQNIFDMMRVDDLLYSEQGSKAAEKIINVRNKHDPVSFYGRHLGAIFDIDNSSAVTHSMEELLVNMRRDESVGINEWKEKKKAFLMLLEAVLDADVPDDVMSCIDNISSICVLDGANGKEKLAERVESARNGALVLPRYNTGNAELDSRLANLDVARQISVVVDHVSDCVFGSDAVGNISRDDAKRMIDVLYDLPHPIDKQSLLPVQPQGWSDSKLDEFVQRWNDTIAGLVVDEYNVDGGINLPAVNGDLKALRTLFRYAISEPAYDEGGVETPLNADSGYTNIADLLNDAISRIRTILDKSSGSVCAKVTLELSQEVTMTREAFLGTLSVSNGHGSKPITDMKMELEITDENDERCENLFQPENAGLVTMQGVSILAGGVSLAANSSGLANILFTPSTKAAETVPKVYYFGGTVTYTDPFVGETVRVKLQPAVPVTVHPSPELTFHYFLQRDVIGDDPFTKDVVEESEPAEVALLILNKGYGDAENVTIKTAEPTIAENEKELKVDFNWIGAALDGASTRLGYRNVDVGTVPAQGSRLAQWWLTSSLQGHFTKVDGSYTRLNSNGNPDFDLIKDVITHTLVRSIMADNDTLPDFLVTEGRFDGIPNVIYMDNGETVDVSEATDVTISGAGANATLTVVPSATGWNYASCRHPFGGGSSISRVTRGDGSEVPLRNVWLTSRTFEDGVDPIVEDRIHIADEMVYGIASTYTIEFGGATPTVDRPQVLGFFGVSELIDGIPAAIEVQFSHDVDATTFDVSDLTLYHQGTAVADLSGLSISASGTSGRFAISGFANLGLGSGTYVLTVQASGVKDLAGISGTGSKSVMWTAVGDNTPPAEIVDLAISPDGGFSDTDGVTYTGALTVTGTLPEAGLTVEIIARYVGGGEMVLATINGEGAVATQFSQDIALPGSGNVTLVVRLTDTAGNSSDTVKNIFVDGIALTGTLTGASDDEGLATAAATLSFSDRVMDGDVTFDKFALTRDGEVVALEGVTFAKVDDTTFTLTGLDALCAEDGVYVLTFNGAAVRKYTSGLPMSGSLVMRWRFENPDSEPPTVTEVLFDGETPHEAYTNVFSSVSVTFSEAVNVPELIEKGLIDRAARIDLLDAAGAITGCVASVRSANAPYQWDAESNMLSWQIDPFTVPAGSARLMLDAGLITDLAGNHLAADGCAAANGLRTYALSETLLAQVYNLEQMYHLNNISRLVEQAQTGDLIPDWWAQLYDVEEYGALDDPDADGLCNYVEFILSDAFDVGAKFDPLNSYSASCTEPDYFFPIGSAYAGELFTDHDMMDDLLEDSWGAAFASRLAWDGQNDADEDGWSNFAEASYHAFTAPIAASYASHIVDDAEIKDMPIPTLKLTLRYNGSQLLTGTGGAQGGQGGNEDANSLVPLVVQTFTRAPYVVPDATFNIQPGEAKTNSFYLGAWAERTVGGTLTPGYVNLDTFNIEYAEIDRNNTYTFVLNDLTPLSPEYAAAHPAGLYCGTYEDYMSALGMFGPEYVELQSSDFAWTSFQDHAAITVTTVDESGEDGYICYMGERIGRINLMTGEFSLDMRPLADLAVVATNENGGTFSMAQSVLRITYDSVVPTLQSNKLNLCLGEPQTGYVKEGPNVIVAFYDLDGDGKYTAGEPMGCAMDVDVGWHQGTADIVLTDTSPIITRADLQTGMSDRKALYGEDDGNYYGLVEGQLPGGKYQRLRVVRTLINGVDINQFGVCNRVLVDCWVNMDQRGYFNEVDVLQNGELDLDWSYLYDEVVNNSAVKSAGVDPTEVTYRIVLGNGSINTAETNNLFDIATTRHFDEATHRTRPIALSPGNADAVVREARPTFMWSMGGFNSYTAFQLQIMSGSTVVWDSGVRRAPSADLNNVYTFTADAYAGDVLANDTSYTWRVSMFNAKFKSTFWSTENPVFRMSVPTAGYGYGTIPVCVRYYGPKVCVDESNVRVEAYTTPDFTGTPVARGYVINGSSLANTSSAHEANCTLIGLPKGTYYVRAWLDLNKSVYGTRYVRDDYEPWGYACGREKTPAQPYAALPVTIDDVNAGMQPVDIYIEDVDTNGNMQPDTWEIVINGGELNNGATGVNAQAMPMWYNGELYVGEKTSDNKGKIRHYAANGTWTYLQSDGVDIEIPAQGCQGASVAFADMDGDGVAETYVGTATGNLLKYPGGETIASLGTNRAMPYAYDIDGDGCDELITGGMDGRIRIISLDEDSGTYSVALISDVNGAPITVLNGRAAPIVSDINHDGLADIVSGDTAGNVWAYLGADAASASLPVHATPISVFTNNVGLADRSRLGYGDVNGDGIEDIIVGRSDGSVTAMLGVETSSPIVPFAVKAVVSASAGTHGVITPVGDATYDGGDTPEYTITPDVGYHVVDVQVDGVSVGETNNYVFVPLTTSHEIHADFAVTPYEIIYAGLKGAANTNPETYTVEDEITFAAPGEVYGWVFTGWTPASIARGSTGALEVTANWERAKFDVTVNGETRQYSYEDMAEFVTNAVINCGATQYVCKGWTATNAEPLSGEGARAEFRVLGDVTLRWLWETNSVTLAQSVNAEGFEWTTGGAAEWMPEWSDEAADNVHQARCGAIPNGTNAWLAATVDGPGTIVFKWRSALASRYTKCQFMIDGEVKGMLTGTNDWMETSFAVLGDRAHEIKWRVLTGRSGSAIGDGVALDCVVWTPTVPPTLAEALNTNLVWTTDGDALWRGVARESLTESRDAWAVVSGLGDDGTSAVQTRVCGSGILFFDWAISCEEDYDWMELTVDGEVRDYISGSSDWTQSAVEIVGDGWHVVRWEFIKDELDDPELAGENIARLDNVVWDSDDIAPEEPDNADLIPAISLDTHASAVDAKIDSIGFADAAVKMTIGGRADEYMSFKAWADVVKNADGKIAGEEMVVNNEHAAVAFLLGAERLFVSEPVVVFESVIVASDANRPRFVVDVAVKDEGSVVIVDAEKVAGMFEATSDLADWDGAAKLTPAVTISGTDASGTMTFSVTPGAETGAAAFLRVKR